ncbi:MAG TPA: gamma-glutamyl-gamma-aminobutyrate hydrolase family protein, partial [Streptosporangiaceae bacterium]|nr:gamma-glutamyl-gamma-aminobutyrate hydrolase family protein [Streptosporangiaceae bacterium]
TVETSPEKLLERVLASPRMTGADLARVVSTSEPYTISPDGPARYRVVAVDLGIKASTPRHLAARGCEVVVVPATTTASQILAEAPDGVFFSNGPGDPAAATYAVDAMRGVLDAGLPVFGICLGSQILALALGLRTYKLRYGHRGLNQPVMDLATGRVYITSHNHGFAAALPGHLPDPADAQGKTLQPAQRAIEPVITGTTGHRAGWTTTERGTTWSHVPPESLEPFDTPYGPAVVSHVNLNDGVVEGLRLEQRPVFSVQYHPEAAPGPHDAADHFDQFCALLDHQTGR